ncbi:MAG: type 1 glutamine amidotransferase [Halothiobacillaceae bacterium]|nr:type 1 glutamine amidotransferase [Halothiobacillaceae bacterium]
MRVHVLQHVPFEDIGGMADWLAARGIRPSYTRFYAQEPLPEPTGIDLLIVMGGPMSVHDEALYPWLADEKAFVGAVMRRGAAVLGVCLGAQLMAVALGGEVTRNPVKEIGWFAVEATPGEGFALPAVFTAFHWHGETFSLPPGAVRLARSQACENQAFQYGRRAIGLQFHLETTPQSARAIVENCRDEMLPGPYVQDEAALLAEPAARYADNQALMGRLLDYLLAA